MKKGGAKRHRVTTRTSPSLSCYLCHSAVRMLQIRRKNRASVVHELRARFRYECSITDQHGLPDKLDLLQPLFDIPRGDVLSPCGDQDVLFPAHDTQKPALVEGSKIAGM